MPSQCPVTLPPAHGKRAGGRCARWHRALAAHARPTTGIRDPDMHRENNGSRSRPLQPRTPCAWGDGASRMSRARRKMPTRCPTARIQTARTASATWCGPSTISHGVATRAAHAGGQGGNPPPPTSRLIRRAFQSCHIWPRGAPPTTTPSAHARWGVKANGQKGAADLHGCGKGQRAADSTSARRGGGVRRSLPPLARRGGCPGEGP